MAAALYDPETGYYTRRIREVGWRGDFATAATLSQALGRAIAHWAWAERSGNGGRWHLVEVGAGSGEMARTILETLGWWRRRSLRYHIVEVSAPLREHQQARLGSRAVWHSGIAEALLACGGEALIISNELVDAFPCRLVERTSQGWAEVWVGDAFSESLVPVGDDEIPASLLAWSPAPGQRCEIHRAYHRWLAECAAALADGTLLTVDYGGSPAEIYHRRPRGTVRAYAQQTRCEGAEVFQNPGRRDLTADVNFDDLLAAGARTGFENVSLTTQREFLQTHLPDFEADSDPALQFLADPLGAGTAFKVLQQRKRRA